MTPYIRTFTGREVNPLNLRVEDIDIRDIAHSLACVNRFAGHTSMPISVAQHSVYVSRLLEGKGQALLGLLHDASEAYLGDVTKWLKHTPEMLAYREAEDRAWRVIAQKFGLPEETTPELDWADRVMVRFEGRQGFGPKFVINHPRYPPLTLHELEAVGNWQPWHWRDAQDAFMTSWRCIENGITLP